MSSFKQRSAFIGLFLVFLAVFTPISSASRLRYGVGQGSVQLPPVLTFTIEPNLLFTKIIRSQVFAIGWEFTVDYQIFNVGTGPATNVIVKDADFVDNKGMFLVLEPNSTAKGHNQILSSGDFTIKSLSPGENVSYSLTAVALRSMFRQEERGHYRFLPAQISYTKGDVKQIGWSSLNYENGVEFITKAQADRRHGSKTEPLLVFALLILIATLVPFGLWKGHTMKYDALQDQVKQAKENRKQLKLAKLH